MLGRAATIAALLIAGAGCTLGTEGMTSSGLGPGGTAASTTGADDTTAAVDDDSDTTDPDPSQNTTSPPDTDEPSETGSPSEAAALAFTPPSIEFGNIASGASLVRSVEVKNIGGATASLVTGFVIPGPFGLPGGSFPGEGGTCGETIEPGDACEIAISFGPDELGPWASSMILEYYDGIDMGQPVEATPVMLGGGSVGDSGNLILNPSATDGLDNWSSLMTWSLNTVEFVDAPQSFRAGNPAGGQTSLTQEIILGQWVMPLALGGVAYEISGSAISPAGGGSYRILLDFNDGAPVTVLTGSETAWEALPANTTGAVPPGTSQVTVVLQCSTPVLTPCGTSFDALSFSLVYPPP